MPRISCVRSLSSLVSNPSSRSAVARIVRALPLMSLLMAGRLLAQESAPAREVGLGARVRILAPDLRAERYIGRIDSLDAQSLTIDTAGARTRLGFDTGPVLVDEYRHVTIRRSMIREIQMSGGRTTRGATIRGAALGAIGGGLLWGFGNMPEVNPQGSDFIRNFPVGAVIGGALGGVVGYLLGGERWYPALLPR